MRRALLSFLLSPRKRGASDRAALNWVPACAGMTGFFWFLMANTASAQLVPIDGGYSLGVGMSEEQVDRTMEMNGWSLLKPKIKLHNSTLLWIKDPCRAAKIEKTRFYEKISMSRPPVKKTLKAEFFICQDNQVKLGKLENFELLRDKNAKNK